MATLGSGNNTYNAKEHGETTTIDGGAGTDTVYLDGRAGVKLSYSFDGTYIHVDGVTGGSAWHFKLINVEKFKYGSKTVDLTAKYPEAFTSDTVAPVASSYSPSVNGTDVSVNSNIVITFSEAIKLGTGNIVLKADGVTVATYSASAPGANLTVSGSILTINPTDNLSVSTLYSVEIASGAITDGSGNAFTQSTTYQFTTSAVNVIEGSAKADTLNGTSNDDEISGLAGNDLIDGLAGADTMIGGLGNDTYSVDDEGDVVTELSGQGTDLVKSSISYTLGADVEKLTLTGSSALDGTGNTLANVITGNTGDNTLDGGDGKDKLLGGEGDDVYIVDVTSAGKLEDTITETKNASNQDTLQLRGTYTATKNVVFTLAANLENLDASATVASHMNIKGNAANNTLTGNDADNVIDGGVGDDTMLGGLGDDTYIVDSIDDVVTEDSNEGIDLVKIVSKVANSTYTLAGNVENGTLANTVASSLTGNALDNVLLGNKAANTLNGDEGDDTLNGGAGVDTMIGGDGDDLYYVDNILDVVNEVASSGNDSVTSTVTFSLDSDAAANVENLTLTGAKKANATGNALENTLLGNSGANILDGGAGADTLTGGAGKDVFLFKHSDAVDVVTDFVAGADKIAFSAAVFANLDAAKAVTAKGVAISASDFLSGTNITASANTGAHLLYDSDSGSLYYDADGAGDGSAVQVALLGSGTHPSLSAADILVVL